jgi:N-acetyl-gamma-glutamyl-phosphate reductase
VVIDAKSGVSGAGRAAEEEMAIVKKSDDTVPYKVTGHRHTPEIAQELTELAGGNGSPPGEAGLTFVPHLLPFDQGELVSCYVRTTEPLDPARMLSLYEERYGDEPFVEVTSEPPGVSGVRGTNLCRIHLALNEASGRTLAFASIDNLWKGAASQAIQNLNLMLGLDEGEGIS